jgi:SAM-dependent methyltransferase
VLEERSPGSLIISLPSTVKDRIKEFVCFALKKSLERQRSRKPDPQWSSLCGTRSSQSQHYAPRWTFSCFYFREPAASLFGGKQGLDVGARVSKKNTDALLHPNAHNLVETAVPHFRYYSALGCQMKAIDLLAPDPDYEEIQFGDARLLSFPSESFDFVTIPMILGPTNVSPTYLELALCLCELARVVRGGGFIYVADAGFQPSLAFAAQHLGLQSYVTKGGSRGLPVGIILRKRGSSDVTRFDELFNLIDVPPLTFHPWKSQRVRNCNLLHDEAAPVIEDA